MASHVQQAHINHLVETAKLERRLDSQIQIFYWDQDGSGPQSFTVVPKYHPFFTLANCPSVILERLHLSRESTNTTDLIQTLDPSTGRWAYHQLETVRNIIYTKVLFYRSIGIKDEEAISREVEKITRSTKSHKRPVPERDSDDSEAPAVRVKRSRPTPTRTVDHEIVFSYSSDSELDSPSPPSSSPSRSSTSLHRSSSPSHPVVPNTNASITAINTNDLLLLPFGHELDLMPSSAHGNGIFPLKYAVSMGRLFERIGSMHHSSLKARFTAAFPAGVVTPWTKSTYHEAISWWNNEEYRDLREKYVAAGYSDQGLWKDFKKEVTRRKRGGERRDVGRILVADDTRL